MSKLEMTSVAGISKDDVNKFLDLCYSHLDENGDGEITRSEYEASIQEIVHLLPESIAGQNGVGSYDFYERMEKIDGLIEYARSEGVSGQIRGCGVWGKVEDYVETYIENNKPHSESLKDRLSASYQGGRLVDYIVETDAAPNEPAPAVIDGIRDIEARFETFYTERAGRNFSEEDRGWLIKHILQSCSAWEGNGAKIHTKDSVLEEAMENGPDLETLPINDLIAMYKLSIITEFMKKQDLTYRFGATMTDLIEEGEADCNIYAAMVIHLNQFLKVKGIDRTGCVLGTQQMPGHCCVRVTLPESNTEFFVDGGDRFYELEPYVREGWLSEGLDEVLPPWMVAVGSHRERASALIEEGMHLESAREYLVACTLSEDPAASMGIDILYEADIGEAILPEWGMSTRDIASDLQLRHAREEPSDEAVSALERGPQFKDDKDGL